MIELVNSAGVEKLKGSKIARVYARMMATGMELIQRCIETSFGTESSSLEELN